MRCLYEKMAHRLSKAYKPQTWNAYKAMFITFLAFCEFSGVQAILPSLSTILVFIEFLCYNGLKPASIINYIVAVRSQMKWFNLPDMVLDHPRVKMMLKAVERTSTVPPKFKGVFDLTTLTTIISLCDRFTSPLVFKSVYLLAFFGFFRISNLLPNSSSTFCYEKTIM